MIHRFQFPYTSEIAEIEIIVEHATPFTVTCTDSKGTMVNRFLLSGNIPSYEVPEPASEVLHRVARWLESNGPA